MEMKPFEFAGFEELTEQELFAVNGGGALQTVLGIGLVVLGCVVIAHAPVIGVAAGIGASVVGTPLVGICAGIAAGATMVAGGAAMIDYGLSLLKR
jgi:bacteriocin-like protein